MRVCFINRSYWPDTEATGQLLTELCEDLAQENEAGGTWDVSVIAGQPNHNADGVEFRPSGTQRRNGVTIHRVQHTRWPKHRLLGRAVNYVTFLWGCLWKAAQIPRGSVVVVETDPPLLCLLGAWLQWWKVCQLVVYLQDIHPEIAVALGHFRDGWFTRFLKRRFHAVYRAADRVIVLSQDMRSHALEIGVSESKIALIPNWVDTDRVVPINANNRLRARYGEFDQFIVMYSGNLGLCQQLDEILEAAKLLRDEVCIRLVFVGRGSTRGRLEQYARDNRLANVAFFDYCAKRELGESLSAADLHLVPLDPRLTRLMMPSKLYGVLASGTPLVAIAPAESHLARIVNEEQVGWIVPPGDARALAEQIRHCFHNRDELIDRGERSRQLAIDQYDRRRITQEFAEFLQELGAPIDPQEPVVASRTTARIQSAQPVEECS
jgi:colanic acid biosynthesis glycosyl transferase WcaI